MVNDADKFMEEDKGREDAIQAKNSLEASIHTIEDTLSDIKIEARLKRKEREDLQNALAEAMECLEANGVNGAKSDYATAQRKLDLAYKRAFTQTTNRRR
ncbi:Heat shock protein ssb1 [Coemansia sp. RSA 2675]|nr:Heat shock protein ssb1 [Coemansia sp. RSA 2675]